MFWVTGSEIKIHIDVSIFRENVCCYLLMYELKRLKRHFYFASVYGEKNMVIQRIKFGMKNFNGKVRVHIIKQSSRKRFHVCRTYDANSCP